MLHNVIKMGMISALFSVLKAMLEDTAHERAKAILKREEMGAAIRCLFADEAKVASGGARAWSGQGSIDWDFDAPVVPHAVPVDSRNSSVDGPLQYNLSVVLMEDQSAGQLINSWSLECKLTTSGGTGTSPASPVYVPCHNDDTGIGHKRIINVILPSASADTAASVAAAAPAAAAVAAPAMTGMRLVIHSHFAVQGQTPRARSLEVYDWASRMNCV